MKIFSKKPTGIILIVGMLFLLIFLDTRGYLGRVNNIGYRVVSPFVVVTKRISKSLIEAISLPFFYNAFLRENERLVEEKNILQEKIIFTIFNKPHKSGRRRNH